MVKETINCINGTKNSRRIYILKIKETNIFFFKNKPNIAEYCLLQHTTFCIIYNIYNTIIITMFCYINDYLIFII